MTHPFSKLAMAALVPFTMLTATTANAQQRFADRKNNNKAKMAVVTDTTKKRVATTTSALGVFVQSNVLANVKENRLASFAFGASYRYGVAYNKGAGGHLFAKAIVFVGGDMQGRDDAKNYNIYGDWRWKNSTDKVHTTRGYAVAGADVEFTLMRDKKKNTTLTAVTSFGVGGAVNETYGNHMEPDKAKLRGMVEISAAARGQVTKNMAIHAGVTFLGVDDVLFANIGATVDLLHKEKKTSCVPCDTRKAPKPQF